LATQYEIGEWLQEGILAAKAGHYDQARFRLLDVVEQDQTNEAAWFWLYQVFDQYEDKRTCLENLLIINPQNQWARQELLSYLQPNEPLPSARPRQKPVVSAPKKATGLSSSLIAIRLVAAFWLGISIIFLGSGIIAISEWLATGLGSGDFVAYLTALRLFELFIATSFVVIGVIGINVAIGLFLRSMAGFYGSILLALLLLLLGPTVSLILTPPNYLAMICTGGISGIVVLLTLAGQNSFK